MDKSKTLSGLALFFKMASTRLLTPVSDIRLAESLSMLSAMPDLNASHTGERSLSSNEQPATLSADNLEVFGLAGKK